MKPVFLFLAIAPFHAGAEITFTKKVLTSEFVAEGAAVADFDGDGHPDITAGAFIWFGPSFEKKAAFTTPPAPLDGAKEYSQFFIAGTADVNEDGKPDILNSGFPGKDTFVFFNPGPESKEPWKRQLLLDVTDGESPAWIDLTGDGKPEFVCHSRGTTGYLEVPWGKTDVPGTFRAIAPANPKLYHKYLHGEGAGDLNGDGRADILDKTGWYEQPADRSGPWPFHPVKFARDGGAHMLVFDVNGDGRNDVVGSLNAHGYGVSWFENTKEGTFTEHPVLDPDPAKKTGGVQFSQPHAFASSDINGDGIPDFVTGKRRWAHGSTGDPDPNGEGVLYWFETKRDGKGGATFIPHEIDRASGVGTQFTITDLNGDKKPDLAIANKAGVFAFIQR